MRLFTKQFNALLWKCWILKKRHYVATFFEFFLPLLTSIFMVVTVATFKPKRIDIKANNDYRNGPTIFNESSFDLNFNLNLRNQMGVSVYFMSSPNNFCTNKFMRAFDSELRSRLIGPSTGIHYLNFKNKEELDIYFGTLRDSNSTLAIGILFNNECNDVWEDFLRYFSFTIKTLAPQTPNFAALFPEKGYSGPSKENFYTQGMVGFLETQNLVNLVYLDEVMKIQKTEKKFKVTNLVARRYPYPAYVDRPPATLIDFLPSVLIYGFIILFPIVVKRQASESYTRVREMFKLMGLNDWAYFGSTFVHYFIELICQCALLTFCYCYKFNGSTSVFNYTNPLLVFVILLMYTLNLILLGFLIAIPFKRPIIAVIVSLIIYVLSDTLRYFIDPKFNKAINSNAINTIQLISCVLPNSSINFVMRVISILELYSNGGNFSNLFETTYQYGSLSVGIILIVNIISMVVYSILIWYLDAVWPFQYGIVKPWYFPLNPILKLFEKEQLDHQSADQTTTNDLKYFEDEKTKNKVKISIQNLSKKFGKKTVVSNINLNLHENHLTALLGHNGAGKTTLMNIITGLYPPTKGKVLIDNYNIQHDPKKARASLSLCPQHNILYDELTAYEHLMIYGIIKGNSTYKELREEIDVLLKKLHLESKKNIISSGYSGGMKRKLNLAIALVGHSKIVILDEPTSGMDPESRRAVWDVLLKEKRTRTILLTTHFIEESDVLGDRIFIMSGGRSRCYGSPVFLKRIFGMGYQLRIAKDLKYNASSEARIKLNDFIRQYFKNSTIMNENVGEVIYSLDTNEENVQDSVFPEFFKKFEQIKSDLHISTFGITVTTLEDVFLKILNMSNSEAMSGSKNQISVSSGYDSSYNLTGTSLNTSMYSESIAPFLEDTSQHDKIKNEFLLLRQRFNGLLIKRLNHSKRYYPMIIFQVVIPVVIFSMILYLDAYLRPSWKDEQSFVLDNKLYGETNGFFEDNNNDKELFVSYNLTGYNSSMHIYHLNHIQPVDYLVNITKKTTISSYIKNELFGAYVFTRAVTRNKENYEMQIEAWYNNEASHSLPLSISAIYNALLDYVNDQGVAWYQKVILINEPIPNQFTFINKYVVITGLKVMWSLLVSLSLPFLAASYAMFPVHEYYTKSKLLQKMCGISGYLYWFSTFIYDIFTHTLVCILIIAVFAIQDKNEIFMSYGQSVSGLFLLLFIFGLTSMQISYVFSRFFSSIGTGFLIIVVFNLIFGVILAVIDFLLVFLVSTEFMTQTTLDVLVWMFRMFPIYSMSRGISNLYMNGSKGHLCDRLSATYLKNNCPRMRILEGCCPELCKTNCFAYKNPYTWTSDGIVIELFCMLLTFVIAFIVNIAIEENLLQKLIAMSRNRNGPVDGNVLLISSNRVERYLENSSEDSDVIQEKRRVETLVEQTNKNNLPQSMLVHHLTKVFNSKFIAVDGLSFALDERECFGLLGVNGAGKTTTFKMLVGDLEPTEGTAYIKNVNLRNDLKNFQKEIGYCPQFDALLDNLTGEEMLSLFGRLRGIKEENLKQTVDCIVKMVDLLEHARNVCSNYSGGNKRKLSLGMALIGLPKIVFLDEPTSGVDAEARRKIWKTLVSVKEKFNCSIVLTSHSMDECEALCSRVAIMVAGKFKCINSVQNLRKKYGKGYTLTIKIKLECLEQRSYLGKLKKEVRSTFPSAILKDFHETLLIYQILDNTLKWSFLFSELEKIKIKFNLEYYLLSDTTLEQLFINFAKNQPPSNQ